MITLSNLDSSSGNIDPAKKRTSRAIQPSFHTQIKLNDSTMNNDTANRPTATHQQLISNVISPPKI